MAYSPHPTVAVDTDYWNGNAPLDQQKGQAAGATPPPATAGSQGRSVAFHSTFVGSTEHSVGAIARGYEVTILR